MQEGEWRRQGRGDAGLPLPGYTAGRGYEPRQAYKARVKDQGREEEEEEKGRKKEIKGAMGGTFPFGSCGHDITFPFKVIIPTTRVGGRWYPSQGRL